MMARHHTDPGTVERLVAGRLDPDDCPPGYRRVAALLGAAKTSPGSFGAAEATDIAAMAVAIRDIHATTPNSPRRKNRMLPSLALAKALIALSAVTLPASAAAAATGHLPGSLQNKVANAVEHVGVHLPGSDATDATGKGATISEKARTTESTGVDKGAEISDDASNGKSRAGDPHGAPESNPAGIETPNSGGLDTAGTASDGAATAGSGNANDAATAGSGNANDAATAGSGNANDAATAGSGNANDAATAGSDNADGHPTAEEHPSGASHPGGRP